MNPWVETMTDFWALTKPRVVQLIVFCAVIGMLLMIAGVVLGLRFGRNRLVGMAAHAVLTVGIVVQTVIMLIGVRVVLVYSLTYFPALMVGRKILHEVIW